MTTRTTTIVEQVHGMLLRAPSNDNNDNDSCCTPLNPKFVDIVDLEQGSSSSSNRCHRGAKLQVTVVSDAFEGQTLLQRHRWVNQCLSELLADGTIHALTLKTYTPTQYEKLPKKEISSS